MFELNMVHYPNVAEIPDDVAALSVHAFLTGSSVMCNPPVLDTDVDIVVLVHQDKFEAAEFEKIGYTMPDDVASYAEPRASGMVSFEGKSPRYLQFFTMRKGGYNLIITSCETLYERMGLATVVSTLLNLQCKHDRRSLFSVIKYGPEMSKNSDGTL